jgi:hypothetical protein
MISRDSIVHAHTHTHIFETIGIEAINTDQHIRHDEKSY